VTGEASDLDRLIDAGEVAEILGLSHRNSVSTYRSRYPDFPKGRPAPWGGRTLLWPRGEIIAWHRGFAERRSGGPGEPNPRLQELVAATARLMMANPGSEISIRQIAAEAGVAHSDLYRYASSKEQLQRLAYAHISDAFAASFPADYDQMVGQLQPLLEAVLERRTAMRVLAHEIISNPAAVPDHRVAISTIADLVAQHRAESGVTSTVDPRVVGACVGALAWGITLFGERWRQVLGLSELPMDQVATVARAILEA
jgi:AcrR family transcriptional regulator/predicted DNA-binding transcriptional regulator AlpA